MFSVLSQGGSSWFVAKHESHKKNLCTSDVRRDPANRTTKLELIIKGKKIIIVFGIKGGLFLIYNKSQVRWGLL